MKRSYILFLIFVLSILTANAQTVSESTAHSRAEAFFATQAANAPGRGNSAPSASLTLAYTSQGNDNTRFYVYNRGENDGYVIMGGDEQAKEVLAYVPQGHFVYDSLPDNMKWWLGQYEQAIDSVVSNQHTRKSMSSMPPANSILNTFEDVPCMITTQWGQAEPFNNCIPQINGITPPTGCAATAVAQIMKYWNYPTSGVGNHSYTYQGGVYSADFEHTTYDWSNMSDTYEEGVYSAQQANAVATLMYNVGVALDMEYSEYASSIPSYSDVGCNYDMSNIRRGLTQYFKYKNSAMRIERPDYTDDEWLQIMYDELSAGRPFLYEGIGAIGGHVFVCHGYSADLKMFAFNWGWNGSADGYYELNPIYGVNGFSESQAMVVGIRPNEGPSSLPVSFGERFESDGLYFHVISPTQKTVALAYHPEGYQQQELTVPSIVSYKGEPYRVIHIGPGAFGYPTPEGGIGMAWSLKRLHLPEGITVLENHGLEDARWIQDIFLPASLKRIGSQNLWYLQNIRKLEIPTSLEHVENLNFQGLAIDSLIIPSPVNIHGINWCPNLKKVVVEENASISLINECHSLKTIILPSTMSFLPAGAFYGCDSLTSCYCFSPDLLASHKDSTGSFLMMTTCDWLGNCTTEYFFDRFSDSVSNGTLYVPSESIEMYDTAYTWRQWGQVQPIQLPASISLSPNELNINVGDSIQLLKAVLPAVPAFDMCRWISSDPQIARVNCSGMVTALRSGDVVIKAIINVGTYLEASCVIHIEDKYTITFVDEDGTPLQTSKVEYGQVPAYNGATPTKAATAQYTYTFAGWSPEVVSVTGAATYTAMYTSTTNSYQISFVNYDGTTLQSGEVNYGVTPTYAGVTPTKPATAQYTYTFKGWDKEIVSVVGIETYTAQFDSVVNKYTITFVDEDGTTLQTSEVEYGQVPAYNGATPSKSATAQYTYAFAGWSPEVVAVTAAAAYTATYSSSVNSYLITFVNYDGTTLQSGVVNYGVTPTYTGTTPIKPATAQYTYTFKGWDKEIVAVVGIETYTAQFDSVVNKYTISFVDEDGTPLQTSDVEYGQIPAYNGTTPSKQATAQYTYTFAGWSPEVVAVTGVATYTATYSSTTNSYLITFVNYDGSTLQSGNVNYGVTPAYTGATPTKPATAQYTYTFKGWDKEIVSVVGAEVYTAQFDSVVNKYTITFVDEDGTTLQTSEVEYGQVPAYSSAAPTKSATAQYTYTFAGWSPEVVAVTAAATYTATYSSTINSYQITFANYDGTTLQSGNVNYGVTPAYIGATPTKPATDQYTYTFKGWDKEIVSVVGAETYVAEFDSIVNKYTITFVDEDGKTLQTSEVEYGQIPAYNGATPTKAATAQYTYTFAGWSPEVVSVTAAATYTATYSSTINSYLITFVNYDGATLQSGNVNYGATPAYTGTTPTKPATAQYTYTFKGWDKEIVSVVGAEVYTAQFDSVVNKYTITFVDEDGTMLQTSEVEYGQVPAYNGTTPTKAATAQYTYAFAGWSPEVVAVTGVATYTATYSSTINSYLITFVNYDGATLQSGNVNYGVTPAYTGATPTKPATAQYTYTFKGWDKEIVAVVGVETYTAQFDSVVNQYTITVIGENCTITGDGTYDYGTEVTLSVTPDDGYWFVQWSDGVVDATRQIIVTEDATYTAITEEQSIGTGWQNVSPSDKTQKIFDGTHYYILRGGKRYTMQGAEVK